MADKKSKVVDKWKTKVWYSVLAPEMFEGKEIAEVVASDEKLLQNRIVKCSLMEMIGSGSQNAMFTALSFRVHEVKGKNAHTKLIGHEISPSYIRTLARRGKTLIHIALPVKTKDDGAVNIKLVVVTGARVSANTKKNMLNTTRDEVLKAAADLSYDQLMQDVLYGRLASKIFNKLKQITYMKRVEVRKSEKKEEFK